MAAKLMVKGMLGNLKVQADHKQFVPGDVTIDVLSRADTTHAVIEGGDFALNTDWHGSYKHVLTAGEKNSNQLAKASEKQTNRPNFVAKTTPHRTI